jgi:protein phosphatase
MGIKSAYLSHPGLVRTNNEDYVHVDDALGIYLLADGMGGHNAGEVASELAVRTAYAYLAEKLQPVDESSITALLCESLLLAHKAVNTKARTEMGLMGMGTTLIEVVVLNDKAYICHAGDSRVYVYRDELQRLTRDHTMADHLLENNILPRNLIPERQWHTLTQSVGVGEPPTPDIKQVDYAAGNILLLCSDGLTDMLADEEISGLLTGNNADLSNTAHSLVDAANRKGGRDNISVVLVRS